MIDIHFLGWRVIEMSILTKFQLCTVVENGHIWSKKGFRKGPKLSMLGFFAQNVYNVHPNDHIRWIWLLWPRNNPLG